MVVFRTDAIALGILLAIWSRHPTYGMARPLILLKRKWLGTLIMCGLFCCMSIIGSTVLHVVSYKFSMFSLFSAFLVWIASYNLNVFVPLEPFKRIMLWIGSRSYAIYLIHIPAFFLTREIWFNLYPSGGHTDAFFYKYLFVAVLLIVIFSELNFRLVETPLRRRGAAMAQRFFESSSSSVTKQSA